MARGWSRWPPGRRAAAGPGARRPLAAALLTLLALPGCTAGAPGAASPAAGISSPPAVTAVLGLGGAPAAAHPLMLAHPVRLPALVLTDTSGAPYDLAARTRGRATLLYFGYTRSPDVAPTTLTDLAIAVRRLPADLAERVVVVMVSTDGGYDTPTRLGRWLAMFGPEFVGLSGRPDQVAALEHAVGAPMVPAPGGHTRSADVLAVGTTGSATYALASEPPPDQVVAALRELLS